ncbi:MAG: dihydrofolate reductase [Rudaea sp.]
MEKSATPPVTLIAAIDRAYAIGRDGAMPWHLPEDLKRFKRLTLGKPVLMGSKTARAIGRILPGRQNLVLTRGSAAPFADQTVVHSIDEGLTLAAGAELCVIGGGELYTLALSRATRLHLTWIDTRVADADAFFPPFDEAQWIETVREAHVADAKHAFDFTFVDYERRQ